MLFENIDHPMNEHPCFLEFERRAVSESEDSSQDNDMNGMEATSSSEVVVCEFGNDIVIYPIYWKQVQRIPEKKTKFSYQILQRDGHLERHLTSWSLPSQPSRTAKLAPY